MGIFFTGRELIEIGIGIEKNGAAFYESLAESTGDAGLQGIYTHLADREREHAEIFRNMLGTSGDYRLPQPLTGEYDAYLKALVDSLIFTDDGTARAMARNAGSDMEAVQTALRVEKDSILYYREMRNLVRRTDRTIVDTLIEEERGHIGQLTELKKSLSKR